MNGKIQAVNRVLRISADDKEVERAHSDVHKFCSSAEKDLLDMSDKLRDFSDQLEAQFKRFSSNLSKRGGDRGLIHILDSVADGLSDRLSDSSVYVKDVAGEIKNIIRYIEENVKS